MLQMMDFEVNNLRDHTSIVDKGGKMLSCMLPQSPFWARKVPSSDAEPVSESFRTRFTVPQESFLAFGDRSREAFVFDRCIERFACLGAARTCSFAPWSSNVHRFPGKGAWRRLRCASRKL